MTNILKTLKNNAAQPGHHVFSRFDLLLQGTLRAHPTSTNPRSDSTSSSAVSAGNPPRSASAATLRNPPAQSQGMHAGNPPGRARGRWERQQKQLIGDVCHSALLGVHVCYTHIYIYIYVCAYAEQSLIRLIIGLTTQIVYSFITGDDL